MTQQKIVIVGGGFGGIHLARKLAADPSFDITLVDRNNYNFFPPLLYQVATAFLEISSICYPFRRMFRKQKNISFRMAELKRVVPGDKRIETSAGCLSYDILVLATGTRTNYFGNENIRRNALPMKTIDDTLSLRNHLIGQWEKAVAATDDAERKRRMTIVVAGAGPTGIEISGMLAAMRKHSLKKDYPELAGFESHIFLVDAGPQVLGAMSQSARTAVYRQLLRLGVEVKLNVTVKDYSDDRLVFADEEIISTSTLVWAAGVTAREIEGLPAGCFGKGKRMLVDGQNKVKDMEDIYAIGDTCLLLSDPAFPNGHPQMAQVAIQQGRLLANNLRAMARGGKTRSFRYNDKGSMAIISRNKAVVDLPKPALHFHGIFAFFIWIFIHLISLVSFRNKMRTFYNWMIAYFTRDQVLRMIIRPTEN